MLKQLRYSLMLLAIATVVAGCGKPGGDQDRQPAPAKVEIEGALTEASYRQAAAKVLASARQGVSDAALTEPRLDAEAAKIEALMAMAGQLNVDKARLDDAELTATLGALYARKAQFHGDNVKLASDYLNKGFRYLDRAVATYPENMTARINRGMVSSKLPAFLNKAAVARDDLRFVLARPEFQQLSPALQASLRAALADAERTLAAVRP